VLREEKHHAVILAAAASDYGPADREMVKTPSGRDRWSLDLKPLPKIVEGVKRVDPDTYLIGFKAEFNVSDDELIERAYERLKKTGMDLVVANDVSRDGAGFGTVTNEVFIIDSERSVIHIPLSGKDEIAERLLSLIKDRLD